MATVANPVFSPVGGIYATFPVSVKVTCATAGASMHFTTDGTTPSISHGLFIASGGTVSIAAGNTLKAMAWKTGATDSAVTSATYTQAAKVATPTFAPDGQTSHLHTIGVAISCATAGATIRYTLDGTTPTSTHGTIITSGNTVSFVTTTEGVILKAIGYKSGLTNSAIKSAGYVYDPSGVK
jgi:chitobiase/beta-hexosaminidase-like protein/Fn3 domain-containing protein